MVELLLVVLFVGFISSTSSETPTEKDAEKFLEHFGYLDAIPKDGVKRSDSQPDDKIKEAIIEFQKFVGINETGILDDATVKIMKSPRCGDRDIEYVTDENSLRRKRYVHMQSKWTKMDLTYRINNFPSILYQGDKDDVRKEIAAAFKAWSAVTPLTFTEKSTIFEKVDINIMWAKRNHGDGVQNAFDGPGVVVAHAFNPEIGLFHFDDDEKWAIGGVIGAENIFQTSLHELGHALGLRHTDYKAAVMYPYTARYSPSYGLHWDDIEGMQAHYGGPHVPNLCRDSTIDAVTTTKDGKTYFFKDAYYWELLGSQGFVKGYPKRISQDWKGLPESIDAAVTWKNGFTYFFKDTEFWKFTNQEPVPGYPRPISAGFPDMPNSPDAVFVWDGDNLTYFIKGNKYWRLKNAFADGIYGEPLGDFQGERLTADAAFQWMSRSYIFTGDKYYRLSKKKLEVDTTFGNISTAKDWFNCMSDDDLNKRVKIS